jgi:hypothetical protein
MKFRHVPPAAVLLVSYCLEAYHLLRARYLGFLPQITTHDILMLQPAMFNYSTLHVLYDDSRARKELGYNPGQNSLEGICLHLLEWNEKVEQKLKAEGKVPDEASALEKTVPVASKSVTI